MTSNSRVFSLKSISVLLFDIYSYKDQGGVSTYLKNLLSYGPKLNLEYSIYISNYSMINRILFSGPYRIIKIISTDLAIIVRFFLRIFISNCVLLYLIIKKKFEIIHVHSLECAIGACILKKIIKIPIILSIHPGISYTNELIRNKMVYTNRFSYSFSKFLERTAYKNLDAIIVYNDSQFQNIIKISGIRVAKKIIHINNSVDTSLFFPSSQRKKNKKYLYFGYLGNFNKWKGIEFIKKFAEDLPDNVILKLAILNKSEQIVYSYFEKAMKKFPDRINLFLNLSHSNIPRFINSIDIIIDPWLLKSNAYSQVTLEALACGKPVIVINEGNRFPIINGYNGFIINKRTFINDLKKIIDQIFSEKININEINSNVKLTSLSNFSLQNNMKKIYKTYYKLIKMRNSQ